MASPKSLRYTWSAGGEQDVGGLDVAVQHPASVGRVERGADLADDARGPERLDAPLRGDQRAQVGALDETHHDEEHAVLVAGIEDGDDVRVVDRGRDPRLAPKALAEALLPGVLGEDELEGDRALERELLGPVDDPHVSVADHLLDAAPREDGAQRELGGQLLPGRVGDCRGRRRCSQRRGRAPGAGGGWQAGGAGDGPAGAGARPTSVNSRVVEPTRTESPTFSAWRPRTRSPLTNVPFADPRSSMLSSPLGVAGNAGVAAGELEIVAQPPLSAHRPPDDELVPEGEPAAQRRPGGDHQHLARLGGHSGGLAGRALPVGPRFAGTAPEPSVTCRTVLPILTTSPRSSVRGASMRSSLTNVPFADPRSSIVS